MKVKTDFKQMVLVDHILYNKLNSKTKPDVHIQHVRTPIINPISSNSIHPHTFPPPPPPPPNYPDPRTAPSSDLAPPKYSTPPTAPSYDLAPHPNNSAPPNPSIPVSNNDWEKEAHQWIDTFQQPNYVSYDNMDKSVQIEDDTNAPQSEAVEYTNTPQRGAIATIESNAAAAAPSQISFEKPMEIEYNPTPSIANEIRKAVEQEKRLHIEYAPPLPLKPQLIVQQPGHLNMLQPPQRMELDYYTPRSITQTMALPAPPIHPSLPTPPTLPSLPAPPTLPSLPAPPILPSLPAPPTLPSLPAPRIHPSLPAPPTLPSLPAPPIHPSLPAPPILPSLHAPPTIPAPLSITQVPTSSRDSSKDEECDECANTVEYEDKLPIAYEANDTKALIPYNDYISMTAKPDVRKKNVFYTCTRCNTNFKKQSSLMNHNKRFHAAFDQVLKGHKRKPKEEVLPYDVPLLKQQKIRGVKRRYEQNTGSNKAMFPYKPYVLEKTT